MHAPPSTQVINPELLMLAYRGGVFPMSDARDDPDIFWVEPRHRAVLPLDGFHLSRSLARTLRRGRFTVTCNAAFSAVMDACAAPRINGESESWISHRIQASYELLHRLGLAHSIECWQRGEDGQPVLVGGLYGVGFDGVFCGESMFSRVRDSSKVGLAWLVAALRKAGAQMLDCQFMTEHLASLGAVEIAQEEYVARLRAAQRAVQSCGAGEAVGDGLAAGAGSAPEPVVPLALPAAFAALLVEAEACGLSSSPGNFIAQLLIQTS